MKVVIRLLVKAATALANREATKHSKAVEKSRKDAPGQQRKARDAASALSAKAAMVRIEANVKYAEAEYYEKVAQAGCPLAKSKMHAARELTHNLKGINL